MQINGFLLSLFWIYIVTECFVCFWRMHKGDKVCRLAKYFVAAVVPCIGVGLHVLLPLQWRWISSLWLVPDLSVALFFWPTTYARFTGGFKNRIGDI